MLFYGIYISINLIAVVKDKIQVKNTVPTESQILCYRRRARHRGEYTRRFDSRVVSGAQGFNNKDNYVNIVA